MATTTLQFDVPVGYDGLDRVYGKFSWHDIENDPGAAIAIDPAWVRAHVVAVKLPDLLPHAVYIHRLVENPFSRALKAAAARKPNYKILSCVSFVPRHKLHNKLKPLSVHSWAAAHDLNPKTNRYGATKPLPAEMVGSPLNSIDWSVYYDMPIEFIEEFQKEGFVWGGTFKDPMHFQLAKGV